MTTALSFVMTRASSWLGPVARCIVAAGPPNSKVAEAIADLAYIRRPRSYALLNEVGQCQQHGHTEHNHDHRRHAAPQA
jgi:hypothetical protein